MQLDDGLTLVAPTVALAEPYAAMVREFMETDEAWFTNFPLALEDFAAFVCELEDEAQGIDLPPDVVPQQTYWLVQDGTAVLGEIRLRPHLTEPFEQHHGHIGYNVRPAQRGHGYATRMLALALEKAREQGLPRVMLTIEGENLASARVIEKNGGKLEWQRQESESGETLACYWIEL
ncbi:MAG TPA: GNAT family N-acetyltransferase [Ktedonobacterales bacterium]|nr:GNAT family N-acetyltransferase [Ktedonobacterales bacterium]